MSFNIPGQEERTEIKARKIEIKKGDLVLIVLGNKTSRSEDGRLDRAHLGVFYNAEKGRKGLVIELLQGYTLFQPELFGGNEIPLISAEQQGFLSGTLPYTILARTEVYSGKDNIVAFLRSEKGWEAHANWIAALKKPYIE